MAEKKAEKQTRRSRLRRDRGLTWALGRKGPGTDPQAAKLDETPLSDVEWVAFAAISRRARRSSAPLRHPLLVLFCHQFGLFSLVSALILDNIPIGGSSRLRKVSREFWMIPICFSKRNGRRRRKSVPVGLAPPGPWVLPGGAETRCIARRCHADCETGERS